MPPDLEPHRRDFATPETLEAFGAAIAARLEPGEAVCLDGPLGAGKTTLARGLVRAVMEDGDVEVPSPTFTLVQLYAAPRLPLAHLDLYRLKRPEEALELGLDEALDVGAAVIEWSERLAGQQPDERLEVVLAPVQIGAAEGRRASWQGFGRWREKAASLAFEGDGRAARIDAFLAQAGLADARREPLPGDASTRRYVRLLRDGRPPLMLMDALPSAESAPCGPDASVQDRHAAGYNALARLSACRVDAFAATAGWLRAQGLSAPEVVAFDVADGLAVTEDLGEGLYARLIEQGADPTPLYTAAIEALVHLHGLAPPPVLLLEGTAGWPLLTYDALALETAGELFLDWWPRYQGSDAFSEEARKTWGALWRPVLDRGEAGATVFTHRDYHAENLIWLPGRQGVARVGLLDFQDAVRAHPAWDLLVLLQDARRDVEPELQAAMLELYLERRPDLPRGPFLADYAALAALNAARILGIFARLIVRDGKPRYRAFLPRVAGYLAQDLEHPDMAGMKAWFARYVPEGVHA